MQEQMLEKKNHLKYHLRGMSPARKLTYTPVYRVLQNYVPVSAVLDRVQKVKQN